MKRLFGRNKDLKDFKDFVANEEYRNILLTGPSGIGKTSFLDTLKSDLESNRLVLYYEVESRAHSKEYIYSKLTSQILDHLRKQNVDFRDIGRIIGDKAKKNKWNIGVNYLLNLLEDVLPGAKGMKEGFYDSLEPTERNLLKAKLFGEELIKNQEREIASGFLCIVQALANNDVPGLIIIDRLESGAEAFLDSLFLLVESLPPNWKLLLSSNDEVPDGINSIEYLWPKMTYKNGLRTELGEIKAHDVIEWKKEASGVDITLELAQNVINTCEGRPLFIEEWIKSNTLEIDPVKILARLGPFYTRKINGLSKNARKLIITLAILPGRLSIPFELCQAVLKTDGVETLQVIDELHQNMLLEYIYPKNDHYKIKHELTREFVIKTTPSSIIKEESINLLSSIQPSLIPTDKIYLEFMKVRLLSYANQIKDNVQNVISTGQDLYKRGSYKLSVEIFDTVIPQVNENNSLLVKANLAKANSQFELGLYTSSLETLSFIEASVLDEKDAIGEYFLLKGKNFMRLNKYQDAKTHLGIARDKFFEDGNHEGEVSVRLVLNIILRDLELYDEAVKDAQQTLEYSNEKKLPNNTIASCYSTLCRATAYTDPVLGITHGKTAVELASKNENIKKIGTSNYALGEAYRHASDASSIDHYNTAITIAESISHSDLLIWAKLSLADAYFIMGNMNKASETLNELKISIRHSQEKYPLETLHFELSCAAIRHLEGTCSFEELEVIAKSYLDYGIKWPSDYIKQIKANIKPPKKL